MTLNDLVGELEGIENREDLCEALETFIQEFKERNVRGYVCVLYVRDNLYQIKKTTDATLPNEKIVRVIKTENMALLEAQLWDKFLSKHVKSDLFKLNDEDVLYIHMLEEA